MKPTIAITLRPNSTDNGFILTFQDYQEKDVFLPPIPQKLQLSLTKWQETYCGLKDVLRCYTPSRVVRLHEGRSAVYSDRQAAETAENVKKELNEWLNRLNNKDQLVQIISHLKHESDCLPILLDLKDRKTTELYHLPWQEWNLFQGSNSEVEIALRVKGRGNEVIVSPQKHRKVKILLVVGRTEGISTKEDLEIIQDLEKKGAEVTALIQPSYKQLCDALSDRGYHIFIFTGHSGSKEDGSIGWIWLNETESLKIDRFKNALKAAIEQGLQLAIFNSCDGLGLANQLAKLNLPQSIVMREPVPDAVAVDFLKHFFAAFTENKSLFASVHYARKKLEVFTEQKESGDFYPGVNWLPTICMRKSALEQPLTWNRLRVSFVIPKCLKKLFELFKFINRWPGLIIGFLIGFLISIFLGLHGNLVEAPPHPKLPITVSASSKVSPIINKIRSDWQIVGKNKPHIRIRVIKRNEEFSQFCRGEIDINYIFREIKPEEIKLCKKNGVEYRIESAYFVSDSDNNSSGAALNSIETVRNSSGAALNSIETVRNSSGAILNSIETVRNSSGAILPLFIYINDRESKKRPELQDFVEYSLKKIQGFS